MPPGSNATAKWRSSEARLIHETNSSPKAVQLYGPDVVQQADARLRAELERIRAAAVKLGLAPAVKARPNKKEK